VSFGARLQFEQMYLLRVVDLPDDGLPTSPIRGSRGIVGDRVIAVAQMKSGLYGKAGETGPAN
jgi:hypothetical protein